MIKASRASYAARYRSPKGILLVGCVQESGTRKNFETREFVMFEFRTDDKLPTLRHERNLVLNKSGEKLKGALFGLDVRRKCTVDRISIDSILATIEEFVRAIETDTVLKIEVQLAASAETSTR